MKCITNGTVLTMDSNYSVLKNGCVVIDGDTIIDIVDADLANQKYNFNEIIDAQNGIIMPGFINGHCHVSMSIFKGVGEDIADRLRKFLFPLEEHMVDEQLVSDGAYLSIAEMLLAGVTTFVDMYYYEDEVAKAADTMGIRCILGESILEKSTPDAISPYGGIDLAIEFIEKWKGHALITPAFAPHATYSLDAEHLVQINELSSRYSVPITMHISETEFELDKFAAEFKCTPIEYLANIGVLSNRLIGAHLTYLTDSDISLLKEYDVGVIHNAASNAKSGRPISPVHDMLKHNIRLGLGTDGPMSGNHQDIISVMHQVTKNQKIKYGDRTIMSAKEVMNLATLGGAKAIGLNDKIGSLEIGKKADIIVIETGTPNMMPLNDYYASVVYSAYSSNVVMTMVNGQLLVNNKQLLHCNLTSILDRANNYINRIKHIVDNHIQ